MALREQTESSGKFLHVQRGALCLKSDRPVEGYTEVTGEVDGEPYTTYVKKFGSVDGFITKIAWETREHAGKTYRGLKITINDDGEVYILDLPFGKRQYDMFTKIAENIDYTKPVEFNAWQDKTDDRVTAFACKQNDEFVPWKYKKDNMGDCPPPTYSELTKKWNYDAQQEWLLKRIVDVVIPHVEKVAPKLPTNAIQHSNTPSDTGNQVLYGNSGFTGEPPEMPPLDLDTATPPDDADAPVGW